MATGYPSAASRSRAATAQGVCHLCRDTVEWVTLTSGSRVPVTPQPHPEGTVYVLAVGAAWRLGLAIRDLGLAAEARANGYQLRTFHNLVCPKQRARERADLA